MPKKSKISGRELPISDFLANLADETQKAKSKKGKLKSIEAEES